MKEEEDGREKRENLKKRKERKRKKELGKTQVKRTGQG